MLKRIIASALVFVLLATALVACGGTKDITPDVAEGSVGHTVWTAFDAAYTANPEMDMAELLNGIFYNEETEETLLPIFPSAMPLEREWLTDEEGNLYLSGFNGAFTAEFVSATQFAPMIGVIPFMGYVFELAEDADVAAFIQYLKDNANLRWNVCTAADDMVIGTKGNLVFFLMCPATFEENPDDGMGGMDL